MKLLMKVSYLFIHLFLNIFLCETYFFADINNEAINSKIWLKKNFEPPHEVLSNWRQSYSLRKTSTDSIANYFEEWPVITSPLAPQLVRSNAKNYQFI